MTGCQKEKMTKGSSTIVEWEECMQAETESLEQESRQAVLMA